MRATSDFVTGRRNARRERAVTIFVAHPSSSALISCGLRRDLAEALAEADASSCARLEGRQEKMR
jgi:hypothetical protein